MGALKEQVRRLSRVANKENGANGGVAGGIHGGGGGGGGAGCGSVEQQEKLESEVKALKAAVESLSVQKASLAATCVRACGGEAPSPGEEAATDPQQALARLVSMLEEARADRDSAARTLGAKVRAAHTHARRPPSFLT